MSSVPPRAASALLSRLRPAWLCDPPGDDDDDAVSVAVSSSAFPPPARTAAPCASMLGGSLWRPALNKAALTTAPASLVPESAEGDGDDAGAAAPALPAAASRRYVCRFWSRDYQAAALSHLDSLLRAGFDGVLLTDLDAYAHFEPDFSDARAAAATANRNVQTGLPFRRDMAEWVLELVRHGRATARALASARGEATGVGAGGGLDPELDAAAEEEAAARALAGPRERDMLNSQNNADDSDDGNNIFGSRDDGAEGSFDEHDADALTRVIARAAARRATSQDTSAEYRAREAAARALQLRLRAIAAGAGQPRFLVYVDCGPGSSGDVGARAGGKGAGELLLSSDFAAVVHGGLVSHLFLTPPRHRASGSGGALGEEEEEEDEDDVAAMGGAPQPAGAVDSVLTALAPLRPRPLLVLETSALQSARAAALQQAAAADVTCVTFADGECALLGVGAGDLGVTLAGARRAKEARDAARKADDAAVAEAAGLEPASDAGRKRGKGKKGKKGRAGDDEEEEEEE